MEPTTLLILGAVVLLLISSHSNTGLVPRSPSAPTNPPPTPPPSNPTNNKPPPGLASLLGFLGGEGNYAQQAGVSPFDGDPFVYILPRQIRPMLYTPLAGDNSSGGTDTDPMTDVGFQVFLQRSGYFGLTNPGTTDLNIGVTSSGEDFIRSIHGDETNTSWGSQHNRRMTSIAYYERAGFLKAMYLQFHKAASLIPLSQVSSPTDIQRAIKFLFGGFTTAAVVPNLLSAESGPDLSAANEAQAGEQAGQILSGLLSSISFGLTGILDSVLNATVVNPAIAGDMNTARQQWLATHGQQLSDDAKNHLDKVLRDVGKVHRLVHGADGTSWVQDPNAPDLPPLIEATTNAHFYLRMPLFDPIPTSDPSKTIYLPWLNDQMSGNSGNVQDRVNDRAKVYRVLDAMGCALFPDNDGLKNPKPFRYYYISKVFGPMLGSVFPPTAEDKNIGQPMYRMPVQTTSLSAMAPTVNAPKSPTVTNTETVNDPISILSRLR